MEKLKFSTKELFFLNYLGLLSCQQGTLSPPNTLLHISQKGIHLHNYNITIKKLTLVPYCCLILRLHLSSSIVPTMSSVAKKIQLNFVHFIQLSCLFSLLKCGKVSQSLTFMTIKLLKMKASCFVDCPSLWVCLLVPHAQIEVILAGILQKYCCVLFIVSCQLTQS